MADQQKEYVLKIGLRVVEPITYDEVDLPFPMTRDSLFGFGKAIAFKAMSSARGLPLEFPLSQIFAFPLRDERFLCQPRIINVSDDRPLSCENQRLQAEVFIRFIVAALMEAYPEFRAVALHQVQPVARGALTDSGLQLSFDGFCW